jgi:glutamate dehydrogenase
MATTQSDAADPRIPDLLDHIAEHVGDDEIELVSRFVTNYYLGLPKTELSTVATQDLCGAALSHWRIASLRSPGQPKIHIYNPRADEHGWQSGHTVIDIVTDDMPFLVDSIQMALSARGLRTFLVIHPVLRVGRDSVGEITSIGAHNELAEESRQESFIHFEVERQTDPDHCAQIKSELLEVLGDVRSAVEDWSAMKARLSEAVIEIEHQPPIFPAEDVREAIALLAWLGDDHFTFLGYREYSIEQHDGAEVLLATPGSGLGILQSPVPAEPSESFVGLPPEIRRQTGKIELLVASKANTKSTIHRPGYYDYIGITRLDSRGRVIGERRFVGLYASTAYNSSVLSVPWVRARVARVLDRAPFPRDSHAGRALINILETYPRDELFHIDEDALYDTIVSISRLQERQRVGLFVHRERYGRFYSCLRATGSLQHQCA